MRRPPRVDGHSQVDYTGSVDAGLLDDGMGCRRIGPQGESAATGEPGCAGVPPLLAFVAFADDNDVLLALQNERVHIGSPGTTSRAPADRAVLDAERLPKRGESPRRGDASHVGGRAAW